MANNTWRDRSVHGGTAWHFGHCGITSGATGDCSMGLVGSFGLSSQAAKSGWPTAIHECVLKCRSCEQCRYVTVSLQYQDCSWYHECSLEDIKSERLFRSGMVSRGGTALPRRKKRVALVFFGKHGHFDEQSGSALRSQSMLPRHRANERLLQVAHAAWKRHLLQSNARDISFDVFAHSWSPETSTSFTELWRGMIRRQKHEPTRYANTTASSSSDLVFRCRVPAIGCERTVSQVLSLEKALSLRREHELEVGEKYDLVLVARHDIALLRPLRLPPAVFGLAGRDVVFPFYCPGRCQGEPAVTPSGATSCTLGGQQCPVTYGGRSPAEFTYWMIDWLFLGAPDAVDAMGDATRRLNEYAMALSRFSPYLGTHALWPWHALSTNLSLHWGLLVTERDVTLARHVATGTLSRACWWERSGPPPEPLHLQRPALLDQMCPYAKLSKCSCRTHERALVTSRNGEIVDVPALV